METIPAIDNFFNLEEAFKAYGFEIRDNGCGSCLAYGFSYKKYGEVNIEFYQCFFQESKSPTDMRVSYYHTENYIPRRKTLFLGVAPTNQHDFDILMQLLFPSDEFLDLLEKNMDEMYLLHSARVPNSTVTISIPNQHKNSTKRR